MNSKNKESEALAVTRKMNYVRQVANWRAWFATADELQFAADLLRPQVMAWWDGITQWQKDKGRRFPPLGCHSVYMMMHGFVIENLCKGAIIRDRPLAFFEKRDRIGIPRELQSHDARALVRKVALPVDSDEEELLHRISRMVKWRGRYPVRVEYSVEIDRLTLDDGSHSSSAWIGHRDVERSEDLVTKLRLHVDAPRSFTTSRDAAP